MFQPLTFKINYILFINMLLVLHIIIPTLSWCFSIKYLDDSGLDISNVLNYNKFNIIIKNDNNLLKIPAQNHRYNTNINMVKNPCKYFLYTNTNKSLIPENKTNFLNTLQNAGFIIDKYDYSNATIGVFNACKKIMLFNYDNENYYIKYTGDKYLINKKTNGNKMLDLINDIDNDSVDLNEKFGFINIKNNDKENTKEQIKMDNTNEIPNKSDYRLKLVVFNDSIRTQNYGKLVSEETKAILELVRNIFIESKANINIKVTEIMNLKDEIEDEGDMLGGFKKYIEPMRYDPKNLGTAVSQADFIILLKERDFKDEISSEKTETLSRMYREHGASYFGGANGLNQSYSVVYTQNGESRYFIAKKIAHELGHSLGVHHDKINGNLMEVSTCSTCENKKRLFSSESIKQMNLFIKENKEVFEDSEIKTNKIPAVVKTRDDAIKYIKSKRRHSYNEILNGVLDGVAPENAEMNYYLFISIFFYIGCIFIAMFYLK